MAFMDSQLGLHTNDFKASKAHTYVRWDRLAVLLAIVVFWVGAIRVLLAV